MTKSFSENLGRGGYGGVYTGKLPNGHLIAVKILNESKDSGEDFINEVYIQNTSTSSVEVRLGWENLFEIALGLAKGWITCIKVATRSSPRIQLGDGGPWGCPGLVIYRPPGNGSYGGGVGVPEACQAVRMPLRGDENWDHRFVLGDLSGVFDVEWNVSDVCAECDERVGNRTTQKILLIGGVTMAALTFTAIIIFLSIRKNYALLKLLGIRKAKTGKELDIELFLKDHGNLAPKRYKYSDLKKMTKSFSENLGKGGYGSVYKGKLPDGRLVAYIYKQLELMGGRLDHGIVNEGASELAKRKLITVGLWCIQTDPKDRPSMSKVVEMLEGKIETLQVPPKPYLSSSPRLALDFSTASQSM
ncbi:probable receptor-like protein kinase at1g67000 [Phtheirospermum japonicum]|uniref:Probable receptor-like protein kinase at1g67000 n=1 Tax=Phtheirospermum japonicum TaxID=374723 RepID=A0A830BEL1_9LAMI|nr:probable receptor-like protein kinase at1g67000 [Phtheirospermum japonicum]